MKKLFVLLAAFLMAASVFAAGSVTVKTVKGTVTYETAPGKKKTVKAGQVLDGSAKVSTGVGSKLVVVKEDGTEATIKASKSGLISELVEDSSAAATGLRTNPGKNTIAAAADSTGKGEATLAERQSIANGSVTAQIDEP